MIAISEHPMAYPVIVETPRDRSCILPVLRGRLCISTWMEMLDCAAFNKVQRTRDVGHHGLDSAARGIGSATSSLGR